MKLKANKQYLMKCGMIININSYDPNSSSFYGEGIECNTAVFGHWLENGEFNTGLPEREIIKEISEETHPELYL